MCVARTFWMETMSALVLPVVAVVVVVVVAVIAAVFTVIHASPRQIGTVLVVRIHMPAIVFSQDLAVHTLFGIIWIYSQPAIAPTIQETTSIVGTICVNCLVCKASNIQNNHDDGTGSFCLHILVEAEVKCRMLIVLQVQLLRQSSDCRGTILIDLVAMDA